MVVQPAQADTARSTGIHRFGTLPVAAFVVTAINALYILLVTIGNITDFGTNFEFVQHVLSMDTTNFGGPSGEGLDPDVTWRAITSGGVHTVTYVLLIAWESITAIVLLAATAKWFGALRSGNYSEVRRLSSLGFLMIVMLFMGGFITVGGEWFQMWRSVAWNGLDPAFRNSVLALFGLVLVHLPSLEWVDRGA
jgi:predicted small integral membrane protein